MHKIKVAFFTLIAAVAVIGVAPLNNVIASGSIVFSTSGTLKESVFSSAGNIYLDIGLSPTPTQEVDIVISTDGQCKPIGEDGNSVTLYYPAGYTGNIQRGIGAVDDNIIEGNHTCTINISTTSADPNHNNKTATTALAIQDNDATPGYQLTSKPGNLTEGQTASYNVRTNDEITDRITFMTSISGPCKLRVIAGKGGGTWEGSTKDSSLDMPTGYLAYTIVATDDAVYTGNRTCTLTNSAPSTSDQNYASKTVPGFSITIIDNEKAPAGASTPTSQQTARTSTTNESAASASGDQKIEKVSPETEALKNVNNLRINEDAITAEKPSFPAKKPIVFSGKTIPNGKVTIYVFSEPKMFTTTADKDGNWRLEATNIPNGDHHAELEVTDPTTNQTSKRSRLLEFTVGNITLESGEPTKNVANAPTAVLDPTNPNRLAWLIGLSSAGALLILATTLAIIGYFKPELRAKLKRAVGLSRK